MELLERCIASDPTEDTESIALLRRTRPPLGCIASDPTEDTERGNRVGQALLPERLHRLRSDRGY